MTNPFNLTDITIRDLPHVKVTRHAPQAGKVCEYRKQFKPDGISDAYYWVQRENEFLLDFTLKRFRHTVELAAFQQDGKAQHTPIVSFVATRDAGITLEDWLKVRPVYDEGSVGRHPFQHAGPFLQMLRACLVALHEIHQHGIVHCDIKDDNICIPFTPYPYGEGQSIQLNFDRVRLIDFAFSITPERPLAHPLPIMPTAGYQSDLLKEALKKDSSGMAQGVWAAQQLDYRVDLFGLGHLASRILDAGLLQPMGSGGRAALQGAQNLVDQLQGYGRTKNPKYLPHDGLITEIDELLSHLVDLDEYRLFQPRWSADNGLGERSRVTGGYSPTPITPIAEVHEQELSEVLWRDDETVNPTIGSWNYSWYPLAAFIVCILLVPYEPGGHLQYFVGSSYERGLLVQKNYQKAVEWYRKAADQGQTEAQEALKRLAVK